jgi:hypothetical protein
MTITNPPIIKSLSEVQKFLANVPHLQEELMKIPIDTKLDSISEIGKLWGDSSYKRRQCLKQKMVEIGLDSALVEEELSMYPTLFNPEYYKIHLDSSASIGGRHLLDKPRDSEHIRRVPYEKGTLIIGAGNSGLPVVVDLTLALLANVAPLIKPDLANFDSVSEVVESIKDAANIGNNKDVLDSLHNSVMVSYFPRDDPTYQFLLTKGDISRVKFTGGEEAYRNISNLASQNPNHTSVLAGGPLTGAVVINEDFIKLNENKLTGTLAEEILIAGQKLCSSPTYGLWVGSYEGAVNFAKELIKEIASRTEILRLSEGNNFTVQRLRLALKSHGANVISPEDGNSCATLVVSDKKSIIDEIYKSNNQLPLGLSKRPIMLEIVSLPDLESAVKEIKDLPNAAAYKGIWKVGTIGYALGNDEKMKLCNMFPTYRIKPIGKMFYREPTEPIGGDGKSLVNFLTYVSYSC